MSLIDTSAWVEFLRGTGSAAHLTLRDAIEFDVATYTTDVIVMEVLAGARDRDHQARLLELFSRAEYVPLEGLGDYQDAASIYLTCRQGGDTVRSLTDCLIAAVALRAQLPVLHNDRDFDAIARHTDLKITIAGTRGSGTSART